jgi:peptidoglycan/LPS O-acetylase OafA/YrhL
MIFDSVNSYNYVGIFPRANSLAMGAMGALLWREKLIPKYILEHKIIEIVTICCIILFLVTDVSVKYFLLPVCSLFLILKCAHEGFKMKAIDSFLTNRKILYLGSISYGIYLFHVPIGFYIDKYLFDQVIWHRINFNALGVFKKIQYNSWLIKLPLYSSIAILFAHFSYRLIEKPILGLKDRWFKY